ncbi:uncharacterized protein LOC128266861 [Anopheles cruzii]|uniref:uncharacterized protein LOC128266861 n=1 Tax=Anopheles cruzii TaxID=68878 RepID=UPI0022EC2981|nr:uncharacterized protein LOC128266861 [Anopheles cruzii]
MNSQLREYLDSIEYLPEELLYGVCETAKIDRSIQSNTEDLNRRVDSLFRKCRRGELSAAVADAEFAVIRDCYEQLLEDSDEKLRLAVSMHDQVANHLQRLDVCLDKLKEELETKRPGSTERLEKRFFGTELGKRTREQMQSRFYDTKTKDAFETSSSDPVGVGNNEVESGVQQDAARCGPVSAQTFDRAGCNGLSIESTGTLVPSDPANADQHYPPLPLAGDAQPQPSDNAAERKQEQPQIVSQMSLQFSQLRLS